MSSLRVSIEPELRETRLMLTQAQMGTALRARPSGLAPATESASRGGTIASVDHPVAVSADRSSFASQAVQDFGGGL